MKFIKRKYIVVLAVFLVAVTTLSFMFLKDILINRESYKDNLIRFHVIANSDSPEDQSLKLQVRDRIISETHSKFDDILTKEESKDIISQNLDEIEYIAKKEIEALGKDYDVKVEFGKSTFPTKNYGAITLPAGEYDAVRVVIGEGVGENWWCVMFPPLCFIDISNGLTDNKTKEELSNVLTEDEYTMLLASKSEDDVPLKLKFKVVEMLEKGKTRFAKLFVSQN